MQRLREEFDSDLNKGVAPTSYRSITNQYEIACSVCNKVLFVDKETKNDFERVAAQDLENRFTCDECEQEYDGLAFE